MDGKVVHLTDLSHLNLEQQKERLSLRRKYQDSNAVPHEYSYTEFVLYMENRDTMDANSVLSKIAKKNKYVNDMAISVLVSVVFFCGFYAIYFSVYYRIRSPAFTTTNSKVEGQIMRGLNTI